MCFSRRLLFAMLGLSCSLTSVEGHGYLYDPPSRSSMWRHGFNVPPNYDDNALYCGGKQIQWGMFDGKCGVCGDRYDGPGENEAGGKYATGIISRTFIEGQIIPITVKITFPHAGWFEFRLCVNNDVRKVITQECLDMHLLGMAKNPESTRFTDVPMGGDPADPEDPLVFQLEYQLPVGLTCSQCVLQWKYNAGNDWGCDSKTNICGLGLGPQEQFYGCADIAIVPRGSGDSATTTTTTKKITAVRPKTTTATPTTRPTTPPKTTQGPTTPRPTTTTPVVITRRPTTRQTTTTPPKTTTKKPTTTRQPTKSTRRKEVRDTTTRRPTTSTTNRTKTAKPVADLRCRGTGVFRGTVMDNRCNFICSQGVCPEITCNDDCRQIYNIQN